MTTFKADPSVAHRLLAPRIAYLIGTRSPEGIPDIAPASNVTSISREPQLIVIAIYKKWRTYQNLLHSKGFTVTVPTADQLDGVWRLGEKYSHFPVPAGVSKLEACGLPIEDRPEWNGPSVGSAIGAFNCRLVQQVEVEADHGVFIGEITDAVFSVTYLTEEGMYKRNARPLMQVVKNSFATSSEHWTIPYFE